MFNILFYLFEHNLFMELNIVCHLQVQLMLMTTRCLNVDISCFAMESFLYILKMSLEIISH